MTWLQGEKHVYDLFIYLFMILTMKVNNCERFFCFTSCSFC